MKNGDFHSVYGTEVFPRLSYKQIKERQDSLDKGDIYIFTCAFIECEASGKQGGAICVSSSESTKMLLESSNFINCKSNNRAGAIYFSSSLGSCVYSKVCGFGCCTVGTKKSYLFDFIFCASNFTYKNQINDSAVAHSVNENSEYTIYHLYGLIVVNGLNSSLNKCLSYAGFASIEKQSTTENPISCLLSFCSFVNNTACAKQIIYFSILYAHKEIKLSNIICNENIQDSDPSGIIHSYGNLTIKHSCILGNKANYTFYAKQLDDFLQPEETISCSITVENCTLDEDIDSKKGSYVTISNIATSSFIHALDRLSTKNCGVKNQTQNAYWKMRRTMAMILITTNLFIPSFLH